MQACKGGKPEKVIPIHSMENIYSYTCMYPEGCWSCIGVYHGKILDVVARVACDQLPCKDWISTKYYPYMYWVTCFYTAK